MCKNVLVCRFVFIYSPDKNSVNQIYDNKMMSICRCFLMEIKNKGFFYMVNFILTSITSFQTNLIKGVTNDVPHLNVFIHKEI